MSDNIEEVVLYRASDGSVHETRAKAQAKNNEVVMRSELAQLIRSDLNDNVDADEVSRWIVERRIRILEIFAYKQVYSATDVLGSSSYSQLRNLDLVTTLLAEKERAVVLGMQAGSGGLGRALDAIEACRNEVLRRLDAGPYT